MPRCTSGKTKNCDRLSTVKAGDTTECVCDCCNRIETYQAEREVKTIETTIKRSKHTLCEMKTFCLVEEEHTTALISRSRSVCKRTVFDSQAKNATRVDDDLQGDARKAARIDVKFRQKAHLRLMSLVIVIKLCLQIS